MLALYNIALLFEHTCMYAFCLTEPTCFIFNTLEPDYISSIYSTCIYYVNMYTSIPLYTVSVPLITGQNFRPQIGNKVEPFKNEL